MKRLMAILLVVTLMSSSFSGFAKGSVVNAAQPENSVTEKQLTENLRETYVNPLYEDVVDVRDIQSSVPVQATTTYGIENYKTDVNVIASQIRDGMVARKASIDVFYLAEEQLQSGYLSKWLDIVFQETENPKAGDYLERHYSSVSVGGSASYHTDGRIKYNLTFTVEYYTTAAQEAILDQEVERVLEEIGAAKGNTDYDNIRKIYDYICDNITYDYANLNDDNYDLKYTAYAALINKTAVCQGYASLYYYMSRSVGVSTRVVKGMSYGERHGWNISRIGDWYYWLDSTWDAGETNYSYFLVGTSNFPNHAPESQYYETEFVNKYPISNTDYDYSSESTDPTKFNLANAKLKTLDGRDFVMQNFEYDESAKQQSGFQVCDDKNEVISSENYDISYKNNINYGVATLTITGKGEYCTGSLVKTFEIYKASIEKLTFELSSTRYVYDGSVKKPKVIVKTPGGVVLKEGTDYWVTFKTNCIDKGTHEVKVTVDNNYRGVETLEFQIVPQGEWIKDHVGWWYKRADGTYPKNGWALIDTDWYYFNASGYRVTGWVKTGGTWYYLMEEGNREEMQDWVNPDVGKMLHGVWFGDKDGKTYYFQENGAMKTGWLLYRGEWYYFNNSGALQKGWQLVGGIWYYFEETGKMSIGWQQIKGTWYYFNGSGAMVVGWQAIRGVWYYFHGSGAMAANQWVGNYYLQTDGSMAVNKRIGIYYVGADGAWIPGR